MSQVYAEQYQQRLSWVLQNEPLWSDLDALKTAAIENGIYSKGLSNIKHVLAGMIDNARKVKRIANSSEPLRPRTELVITAANFDELIRQRAVIDILTNIKHPVRSMDESGYTYYDYALFKRQKHGRPPQHVIAEINIVFRGGDIDYIF